jgi:RHH-type proline utilization regulon transcriptional repressor/proline dehydrogenase/delta 1-pyrroline-5-carboxylate dehydrogenase
MLREFALSTKEGLALMVLAEALLRVPDARTADQFIEDKLGQGDFVHHETRSSAFLVNASAWTLGMSARVIQPGETPQGTIGRLTKRLGAPAVRAATRQAMRLMGSHFVLGETIEAALARAQSHTTPSAISNPTPARSTRSARRPAKIPCPTGPAFPSSSPRCIRASRR